jgi:hypothetical protein
MLKPLIPLQACLAACALCACAGAVAGEAKEREPAPRAAPSVPQQQRAEPQQQRSERPAPPVAPAQARFDQRALEARVDLRKQQQSLQQEQGNRNADAFRRNGRLTADERRDLRRQINEAGQDIYPNTPRR